MKTAEEMFKERADYDFKSSGSFSGTIDGLDGIPFIRRKAIYNIMEAYAAQSKGWTDEDLRNAFKAGTVVGLESPTTISGKTRVKYWLEKEDEYMKQLQKLDSAS